MDPTPSKKKATKRLRDTSPGRNDSPPKSNDTKTTAVVNSVGTQVDEIDLHPNGQLLLLERMNENDISNILEKKRQILLDFSSALDLAIENSIN